MIFCNRHERKNKNTDSKSVHRRTKLLFPLACAIEFLLGFESGGLQLIVTDIARTFGFNNTMMGITISLKYFAFIAMPLVFGHIADKAGKKRVLLFFIPTLAIGSFLAVTATVSPIFMLSLFIIGSGYGVSESLITAAVSDSDRVRAERKINMMAALFSIGAIVSPIVIGLLMSNGFRWQILFVLVGVGSVFLFAALLFTHFKVEPFPQELANKPESPLKLFGSKLFLLILISLLIYSGLEVGIAFFVDSFMSYELLSPQYGGITISVFWFSTLVSRLMFSRIYVNAMRATYLFYGLMSVSLLALALSLSVTFTILLYAVLGFLIGPIWGFLMATATKTFAKQSGGAASIVTAGSGAGAALFPFVLGAGADVFSLRVSIGLLSAIALLICIKGWWMILRRGVIE